MTHFKISVTVITAEIINFFSYFYRSIMAQTKHLKKAPLDLRQFLATERPLKMMKIAFYFTLKVLFVFKYKYKIFKFLS